MNKIKQKLQDIIAAPYADLEDRIGAIYSDLDYIEEQMMNQELRIEQLVGDLEALSDTVAQFSKTGATIAPVKLDITEWVTVNYYANVTLTLPSNEERELFSERCFHVWRATHHGKSPVKKNGHSMYPVGFLNDMQAGKYDHL